MSFTYWRKTVLGKKKKLTSLWPSLLPDDEHWVIDTDYDNYAIHYSCRLVDSDGTCLDSYSFVFSRHPTGLRAEDQAIITQRKMEVCLLGKYRRVVHNGGLSSTKYLLVCSVLDWSVMFCQPVIQMRLKTKWMIDWITLCETLWSLPDFINFLIQKDLCRW